MRGDGLGPLVRADRAEDLAAAAWRWPHFAPLEMACQADHRAPGDRGRLVVAEALLDRLEALRLMLGGPLVVTSAYRTPAWNLLVSTTGPDGPHTTGGAVDLARTAEQMAPAIAAALQLGFRGFGVAPGRGFLHLDLLERAGPGRPVLWTY